MQSSNNNDDSSYNNNNNDNITNYLEANKDILLDLVEKHYENLVESLTNNAINADDTSSSDLTS